MVSTCDALMLGRLSQDAMSAVSLAGQITFVHTLFMLALTTGCSMFAAQYYGAGSVVTRDIPAGVVAAGNPCRVMREIGEHDKQYYFRDREVSTADLAEEAKLR